MIDRLVQEALLVEVQAVAALSQLSRRSSPRKRDPSYSAEKLDSRFRGDERSVHYTGLSIRLTWAPTIRQPSGNFTQVCICRPILPGADGRS